MPRIAPIDPARADDATDNLVTWFALKLVRERGGLGDDDIDFPRVDLQSAA